MNKIIDFILDLLLAEPFQIQGFNCGVEDFYIGDWFNLLDRKEVSEDSVTEFWVKVGFDKDLDFGLFEREVRGDAEQSCKMVDAKLSIWKDHFVPKSNNLEYFLSM